MKAKINVGFTSRIQAVSFNPVESTDSMEIEVEYTDEQELERKIEHFQALIRRRTIRNTVEGAKELIAERAKAFLEKE